MKVIGKQRGFTLLELMVVIAILGVLAVMAYPSFQYTLAVNRARYGESEINKALAYARSEAISRNQYVGICPKDSSNPDACATSLNDCPKKNPQVNGCSWSNGFLVYTHRNPSDLDTLPTLDPDKDILQHFYLTEQPLVIKLNTPRLIWKAGGLVLHSPAGVVGQTIDIIPSTNPNSPDHHRECKIATTGQTLCITKK